MRILQETLRAAIAQASPVMFNKEATLKKVVAQIEEAGRNGAQLIVFPESLVPCYPYGLTFGFTVGSRSEPSGPIGSATTKSPSSSAAIWNPLQPPPRPLASTSA